MSQPLRLSDSQMDAVMRAAQPLAPNVRVAFLDLGHRASHGKYD